jgi:hypothetical protein
MSRTFARFTVIECKEAYDLYHGKHMLMFQVAVNIGQTWKDTDLMIDAYASHLTLDAKGAE